jgi:hypothetical protein
MKLFLFCLSFFALTSGSRAEDDICISESNIFTVKVNLFASQYGFFTFEECGETVNPTIGLKVGEVYTFKQADVSNYYHPMGFAYDVDGALEDSPELEPGNTPPGSDSDCLDDLTCPAPIYFKDGDRLGDYDNLDDGDISVDEDNFGLDDYEPEFFYPLAEWAGAAYEIQLRFTVDDIDQDCFYFCHIHAGMTGRIKILDDSGDAIVEEDTPVIPYSYEAPTGLDEVCGTSGINAFELPNSQCPSRFVCLSPEGTESSELQTFANCIDAMNCAMIVGMTTLDNEEGGALFSYQMIPHHINAVNMAKALLKFGDFDCDDYTEETDECTFEILAREIIVVQNYQIQGLEYVLEELGVDETNDCEIFTDT